MFSNSDGVSWKILLSRRSSGFTRLLRDFLAVVLVARFKTALRVFFLWEKRYRIIWSRELSSTGVTWDFGMILTMHESTLGVGRKAVLGTKSMS